MPEQSQSSPMGVTVGPLNGVRVLELTAHLAGPLAGMILADLGAEVIKIEPPAPREAGVGGAVRYQQRGTNAYFLSFNRSKKSLAVDLKAPQGKELFYKLVGKSDVVLDNFRVGVLERLGVDYESLKKINPRIISCSSTRRIWGSTRRRFLLTFWVIPRRGLPSSARRRSSFRGA